MALLVFTCLALAILAVYLSGRDKQGWKPRAPANAAMKGGVGAGAAPDAGLVGDLEWQV